ncbi:MAG: AAA family ATPase [Bacteroidetes bacterium]|nr:AAA family ATPase [Bacteroidota bacterium]
MITTDQRLKIVVEIKDNEKNYSSAAKYAVAIGINPAQLSRIKKGDIANVLSDAKWITIARRLAVELGTQTKHITVKTPVFQFITAQLDACKRYSQSGMLCDIADIGKTYAARYYARTHKNSVYIDSSQCKSKQKFVRNLAKEFGLNNTGRYVDVYADLVYYIKTISQPIAIIDEAGDLDYSAFLELKALWNATECACGWYMMGADGLKAKIDGNIGRKKVGYTEIFSRYGSRYQKITPEGSEANKEFAKKQTALIAKANGITDIQNLYAHTHGSLRRIYIELQKLNNEKI